MVKLDSIYIAWLVACYSVSLQDELNQKQRELQELQQTEQTQVIIESIEAQQESIAYTISELERLEAFKNLFKMGFDSYDFVAVPRGELDKLGF